jgi:hypothetical protein
MSPKPLYDFDFDHEDDDSPGIDHLDWSEPSSSMDNFSKYDNYSQYGSSDRWGSNRKRSLLDLVNNDDDIESSRQNLNRREEDSLMQLLSNDDIQELSSRPYLFDSSSELEEDGSLMQLLNNEDLFDSSVKQDDGSLMQFLSNQSHDSSLRQPDTFGPDLDFTSDNIDQHSISRQPDLFGPDLQFTSDPSMHFQLDQYYDDIQEPQEVYDETPLSDLLREQDAYKSKYDHLQRLELQLEIESSEEATAKGLSVLKSARDRLDHGTIPAIRNELSSWYASLTAAIELEQWMYLNGDYKSLTSNYLEGNAKDNESKDTSNDSTDNGIQGSVNKGVAVNRTIYGPLLCLLPPQKIAILLAHTALSSTMSAGDEGMKVVSLAIQIAQTLETEINVSRALRVRASKQKAKMSNPFEGAEGGDDVTHINMPKTDHEATKKIDLSGENLDVDKWVYTATHLQRFLDEISNVKSGSPEQKLLKGKGRIRPALVRKRCQEILLAEGFMQENGEAITQRPLSMNDFAEWDPAVKVKLGAALIQLLLEHTTYSKSRDAETGEPEPAFMHARKKIENRSRLKFQGLIKVHPDLLHVAMKSELSPESISLSQRFMQNSRCQPMVLPPRDWKSVHEGGYEFIKVDFMRTRQCKTQKVSTDYSIQDLMSLQFFISTSFLSRILFAVQTFLQCLRG